MLTLLCIAVLVYTLRLAFFLVGQGRNIPSTESRDSVPFVSVIVPARNEEDNLVRCVEALCASNYPQGRLEIIVVNDRSEDGTEAELDALSQRFSLLTPLHRRDTLDHPNLKGKPGALQHGIDHAKGEVLVLTDADCLVHPDWIRSMSNPFQDPSVAMVCGFTVIRIRRLFDVLQDIEWIYTQTMARAGIQNGIPLGCFGNNMAIRTSSFNALGGYESIPFSITEDLALLQAMTTAGMGIRYLCSPEVAVETLPCITLGEYLAQKHRWVRGGMALGFKAATFVATSAVYWIGLIASIATHQWYWVAGFLSLRVAGDGLLLTTSITRLQRWRVLPAVAPSILALLLLELLLPFMTLRKRIVWKNQIFRQ
ncbi:MAG: glycosyltransferase [Candidatus Kapabacteria bacterium]|nr:glycosyltransferase [Candidatus Kapabacteria bacterium]